MASATSTGIVDPILSKPTELMELKDVWYDVPVKGTDIFTVDYGSVSTKISVKNKVTGSSTIVTSDTHPRPLHIYGNRKATCELRLPNCELPYCEFETATSEFYKINYRSCEYVLF